MDKSRNVNAPLATPIPSLWHGADKNSLRKLEVYFGSQSERGWSVAAGPARH